jgi:hypothetical protein
VNLTIKPSLLFQHILADASVLFAILTQVLSGIHLDPTASAIMGVFGVLLHPQTSITATTTPPSPPSPPVA